MNTKKISVPIFCECRLPNDKKEYAQCSQYSRWYHPNCVMVPEWVIKTKRKYQKCKNRRTLRLSNSLVWVTLCFPVVRHRDLDRVCVLVVWVGEGDRGQAKKLSLSLPKDFILAKARQIYLSNGDPLGVKGLKAISLNPFPPMSDFIDFTYKMETLSS